MSLERVLKIFKRFGFSKTDAEVYIYLAKKGPRRETDLSASLNITKQQLYRSLKNLKNKGIVTVTLEQSDLFSAVSFERVLDLLVKVNFEQARAIKETKEELLASWKSMNTKFST